MLYITRDSDLLSHVGEENLGHKIGGSGGGEARLGLKFESLAEKSSWSLLQHAHFTQR